MKKILFVVFLLVISCTLSKEALSYQAISNELGCKSVCKDVMIALENNKVNKAFDILSRYWLFGSLELNKLQANTISQIKGIKPRFGKITGSEYIKKETVTNTLIKYTYLLRFERHALRWMFTFYKPNSKWLLNSFQWDDKIQLLF